MRQPESTSTSSSRGWARPASRRIVALLLAGAVGLVCVYSGLAVYKAYDYTTTPRQNVGEQTPDDFGMAYESVSFSSQAADDLNLQGWWIEKPGAQQAVVLVHGRYQNRTSMFDLAERLWERGYNLLLFDLRGHGLSPEASCTYGLQERWDVLGAVDFVAGRGIDRMSIGVLGWSLGGASALMAMEQEPGLPAVVSDSAYADGSPLLARNPLRPGLKLALRLVRGVDLNDVRPDQAVGRATSGSVLLIHGQDDRSVPISHLGRIQDSGSERVIDTWIAPGADHLGAYAQFPDEYIERVDAFFTAALGSVIQT